MLKRAHKIIVFNNTVMDNVYNFLEFTPLKMSNITYIRFLLKYIYYTTIFIKKLTLTLTLTLSLLLHSLHLQQSPCLRFTYIVSFRTWATTATTSTSATSATSGTPTPLFITVTFTAFASKSK